MKRVLTAAVFVPLLLLVLLWGPVWAFELVVAVAALLGTREVAGLAERSRAPIYRWTALIFGGGAVFLFLDPERSAGRLLLMLSAVCAFSIVRAALDGGGEGAFAAVSGTVFAVFYPGVLLGYLVALRVTGEDGRLLVLFVLIVVWASDTAAYYVGRSLGRHRIAPTISPGKTVEGTVAGVVAAAASALACRYLLLPQLGAWAPLLGGVLGVAGFLGDLGESALKRGAGAKHSGDLLPGHGGIMDRVDSLILVAPVVYYYYRAALA